MGEVEIPQRCLRPFLARSLAPCSGRRWHGPWRLWSRPRPLDAPCPTKEIRTELWALPAIRSRREKKRKKPDISTSFNRNNSKSCIRNTRKKKRKRRRRRRTTERRKQTEFNLRIFLHPKNVLSSTQMTIHSDNDLLFDSSEFPTFLRFIDD